MRVGQLAGISVLFLAVGCEKHLSVANMGQTTARLFVESDGSVHVGVDLGSASGKCVFLGSPSSIKATLNGTPMRIASSGGGDAGSYFCESFEAVLDQAPAGPAAHVEITDGHGTIVIEAPDLLAPRKMTVLTEVRADAWFDFSYEPASDEVFGGLAHGLGTHPFPVTNTVGRMPPTGTAVLRRPGEQATAQDLLFSRASNGVLHAFVIAAVTPGKYDLAITTKLLRPQSKVVRCEGVKECVAMPAPPPPVTVDVLPRTMR